MKLKYSILLLINVLLTASYCQKPTLELTFTAKNYLQNISLDSVNIQNLTQEVDTTIFYPDTVLVIDYISNVFKNLDKEKSILYLSSNHPNPFANSTRFHISLSKNKKTSVIIYDYLGKEIANFSNELAIGKHSFVFHSGHEGFYILTVTTEESMKTVKMISNGNNISGNYDYSLNYTGYEYYKNIYKSHNGTNSFVFNIGDELKFTAYTSIGNLSITDSPDSNETYEFQYTGVPCPGMPVVTDVEGNSYNTVQIGNQCWMKENLKTTKYNNGTSIPNVTDSTSWPNLTKGAYVWYNNDINWKNIYGALYNWYTVIDSNEICPTGWHVPSHDEWTMLTDFIGGWIPPYGNMLKSCRQVNSPLAGDCLTDEHPRWEAYENYYGTDDFGFSGLPGGYRYWGDGTFIYIGRIGICWSTTEFPLTGGARLTGLFHNYDLVYHGDRHKNDGFSVRCIKD